MGVKGVEGLWEDGECPQLNITNGIDNSGKGVSVRVWEDGV